MSSTRVLLIHNSYSKYGGEDRVFFQERDALKEKLGEQVIWEYRVTTEGLTPLNFLQHIFFSFKHYREVYQLIKKNKIQLVHIHNFFPLLSAAVFKAAHKAGAVVVHTLHNYRWWCVNGIFYRNDSGICTACVDNGNRWHAVKYRCYRNSRFQSIIASLAFSSYRSLGAWKHIDKFLVLSKFQEQWVTQLGLPSEKIVYKPNWISSPKMSPIAERKGFVVVGRIEPSKGIEHLLSTWAALPLDEVLTVIGDGPLETKLKQTYKDEKRIQFLGVCKQEETLKHISRARFLLQTSYLFESFGLTIIEAMQYGIPVIGYSIGTRKELIQNGINGFLCSPENLSDTLIKASSYEAYNDLCSNAITFAKQYAQEKIVDLQLGLYRQWITEKNTKLESGA